MVASPFLRSVLAGFAFFSHGLFLVLGDQRPTHVFSFNSDLLGVARFRPFLFFALRPPPSFPLNGYSFSLLFVRSLARMFVIFFQSWFSFVYARSNDLLRTSEEFISSSFAQSPASLFHFPLPSFLLGALRQSVADLRPSFPDQRPSFRSLFFPFSITPPPSSGFLNPPSPPLSPQPSLYGVMSSCPFFIRAFFLRFKIIAGP